jgi:hypothetical protein
MSTRAPRLLLDVLLGLFVAGGIAPLVIVFLPADRRRAWIVWAIAIACVAGVRIIRRLATRSPASGGRNL